MKIKKFAFGNMTEAFVESRFSNKTNLIFSNENNKGKTLVLQGIMYSIGNEPIFPSGFNYPDYYFYTKVDFSGVFVEFLRKKSTIIIKSEGIYQVCNTISEFKYFLKEYIPDIPEIIKSDQLRLVDPALFYELFFIGQDKRDTSNVISKGFYNKKDFENMLYAISGIRRPSLSSYEIKKIKDDIKIRVDRVKSLNKEIRELKINPNVAEFVLSSKDAEQFENKKKTLKVIQERISSIKRSRSREENRMYKLESLLVELNSLNRKVDMGKVVCADCGSERILYKGGDLDVDISNKIVRESIVESIKRSISLKVEIIDELSRNVSKEQNYVNAELEDVSPEMRDIFLYKGELKDASQIDSDIVKIRQEIDALKSDLNENSSDTVEDREKKTDLIEELITLMNSYYERIDLSGGMSFDGLFTKKGVTYSGSTSQEFYFCKIMAIRDHFKHDYPIIIDSFRDGEVSTNREELMLDSFGSIANQVILTSTLKNEEYSSEKYVSSENINVLDYSNNKDRKILSPEYVEGFVELVKSFNLDVNREIGI